MLRALAKRIAWLVPVYFGITLISFFIIHLAPGTPTDALTGLNPKISFEARQKLQHLYGLDTPLPAQYAQWLGRFVRFDFGRSFIDDRPVTEKILERLPVTLLINVSAMLLILGLGIPLGIISAVKRGSLADRAGTVGAFIAFSMPEFWLALILMNLFGIGLGWLPISGITSLDFEYYGPLHKVIDVARHLILPVGIASLGSLAGISRYMRSSMVGIIGQDFIRACRAKGMHERDVIYGHALKNACLPVITILGLSVPGLIGGSVIFESIFAIPGMGRLFYESVMARDYATIMGCLSIGALLTLAGNLVADLAYSFADPRIRIEEGASRE